MASLDEVPKSNKYVDSSMSSSINQNMLETIIDKRTNGATDVIDNKSELVYSFSNGISDMVIYRYIFIKGILFDRHNLSSSKNIIVFKDIAQDTIGSILNMIIGKVVGYNQKDELYLDIDFQKALVQSELDEIKEEVTGISEIGEDSIDVQQYQVDNYKIETDVLRDSVERYLSECIIKRFISEELQYFKDEPIHIDYKVDSEPYVYSIYEDKTVVLSGYYAPEQKDKLNQNEINNLAGKVKFRQYKNLPDYIDCRVGNDIYSIYGDGTAVLSGYCDCDSKQNQDSDYSVIYGLIDEMNSRLYDKHLEDKCLENHIDCRMGSYVYSIYGDKSVVISGYDAPARVPEEYKIPNFVTEVGDNAFIRKEQNQGGRPKTIPEQEIIVPKSVKRIGKYAFQDNRMWRLVFEHENVDKLVLCEGAFIKTDIKSMVNFPAKACYEGVPLMSDNSNAIFKPCTELCLNSEHLKEENVDGIRSIINMVVDSVVVLENVSEIPDNAFINCNTLKYVYIKNRNVKLEKIGCNAFSGCVNLRKICELGIEDEVEEGTCDLSSCEEIGECAFEGCEYLTTVNSKYVL